MRRVAVAAAVSAVFWSAPAARAQIPVTDAGSIAQLIQQVTTSTKQLQAEIQTLQTTISFYQNAIQNTVNLPGSTYRNITGEIQQIQNFANRASMLTGQTGLMLSNLGNTGGYPVTSMAQLRAQMLADNNAVSNAMRSAGQANNLLQSQMQANSQNLAALQSEAMGSGGREMTLQTLAGINAATGQQVVKVQASEAALMQAMLTAQVTMADRQAAQEALSQQDLKNAQDADCAMLAAGGGSSWVCSAQ